MRFLAFLVPLFLLMPLSACGSKYDAVSAANTLEQKTFALYAEFVIAKEAAADFVSNSSTPRSVVIAIGTANRAATPLVHAARDLAIEYARLRRDFDGIRASGGTPQQELVDKMMAVSNRLMGAYANAEPDVRKFIAAVNSFKRG